MEQERRRNEEVASDHKNLMNKNQENERKLQEISRQIEAEKAKRR